MAEICVPCIHSAVKLGEVAGDCRSKGDTTLLIFAKFDTAHAHGRLFLEPEPVYKPWSLVFGCARGFCCFPGWVQVLCLDSLAVVCHEQL